MVQREGKRIKEYPGTREDALCLQSSLYKPEALALDPQFPHKRRTWQCTSVWGWRRDGRRQVDSKGSIACQDSWSGKWQVLREHLSQKKNQVRATKEDVVINLCIKQGC